MKLFQKIDQITMFRLQKDDLSFERTYYIQDYLNLYKVCRFRFTAHVTINAVDAELYSNV